MTGPEISTESSTNWREFPWWLVAIFAFLILMAVLIVIKPGPRLLIRQADAEQIGSIEDISGNNDTQIMGVQADTPSYDIAVEDFPEERLVIFAQLDEAVQALLDGDIDVVMMERGEADEYVSADEDELTAVPAFINEYNEAFVFILPGIIITLRITLLGFGFALIIGLLAGLGRISQNGFVRNVAITYVEFIRGVPTLVLIFTLAFVIVPAMSDAIGIDNRDVSTEARGIVSLAIIYGAFLAEIFRAGIESIAKGQMEAARSLGMTYRQSMQFIILPQAIRNISPALGNDFIAMLKDSSLISVLAVRELTQRARLHAGSSFRFRESYLVLTFFYLSMTIALSLLLRWYERRMKER